ncbi:MAG: phosphoribosylamine--glycine ligase [Treponema sp.]|nr:phosphoribosylamine--glycine ligase [Treponema sp.]
MKVLVIGSGGREHAMVWKLLQSPKVSKVYAAPGNGGTAGFVSESGKKCENVDLLGRDPCETEIQEALIRYVKKEKIDLTVVGPEAPLAAGIADRFNEAGLPIAGPGKKAAMLESSKAYAKSFMNTYGVRAARSYTFTDPNKALEAAREHFGGIGNHGKTAGKPGKKSAETSPAGAVPPLVIKADGLAAGKGVVIASGMKEAAETIVSFMEEGKLGGAGKTIVIEEFLEGSEVSVLAAVSAGKNGCILPFAPARDHKRRFDNDQGPNTGGMGAIAPAPGFSAAARGDFEEAILKPTLKGIRAEGFDYRGFIFFGLMIQNETCRLLEYNVRLGDPETQAVLPLMKSDFAELCLSIVNGSLGSFSLEWKPGAVCAPVAVADGYPGEYRKGDAIAFNEKAFAKTGAVLFAAGAVRGPGGPGGSGLRTAGGRVLAVSAYGAGPEEARKKAYAALDAVAFDGMAFRRDIGGS